ncbi:MAG: glycogen debranching enzyme family protein [bacterium]|nr:glycogen debranching enzyme family protein [bacterium]
MTTCPLPDRSAEWLEADGLGGFASGTVDQIRTRRYHALLLAATAPPTGRMVLVNGHEAWVDTPHGSFALTSQRYAGDVVAGDGATRLTAFTTEPWPTWTWTLPDGTRVRQELVVPKGTAAAVLAWSLVAPADDVRLRVRLLHSGRDHHALHHENPAFRFDPTTEDGALVWRPYDGVPAVAVRASGIYEHAPDWYRRFLYTEERARGLDCTEDLATPGVFHFALSPGEATLVLTTATTPAQDSVAVRHAERVRRVSLGPRLHRAADAYLVARGNGKTIVAGYPWFTDWGRDTFIALRGLCLATGRFDDARAILCEWAHQVSDGMLPNCFPDHGDAPQWNTVDAALWFVVAVHEYLRRAPTIDARDARLLRGAVASILVGYATGTRHGIRADQDGLLAAGAPGLQLTWMDARVGGHVVTPRIGKPVEIQALWLNALRVGAGFDDRWAALAVRGRASFEARFWNEARGCLYDVVDVDHRPATADGRLRPNQIFAVGGLPFSLLEGERARRVVEVVEASLWTPLGLRTLAPGEPGYVGHYGGGPEARDAGYHQGTAWPWLLGAFVEAWVRVRGDTPEARAEARHRFLAPVLAHLDQAGLDHVSEIVDGDAPHTPRGCPFQAWSVGETLRLAELVLADDTARAGVAC